MWKNWTKTGSQSTDYKRIAQRDTKSLALLVKPAQLKEFGSLKGEETFLRASVVVFRPKEL